MTTLMKNILVYVDGTEESVTAAQYAIVLSRTTGAELTALYVVNTRALDDLVKSKIFLKSEEEEYKVDLERDAERYLNHVKNLAREKGVSIKTIHTSGTVQAEVKKRVKELDIDLLVIGELSRIRSRRDEFFNEAERAMRSVDCPVLVVKNNEDTWNLYENY